MTTRNRKTDSPGLTDLEGATNPAEAPGIMPPPGTEAKVRTTIDYNRVIVDPEDYYSKDLRDLAAEEDDKPTPAPLTDPLTEFCHVWRNFAGYSLRVVRLPDPANKRMPGQAYNNTCLEITSLGSLPFDPDNIVPTLQLINGNSGGAFRLFLSDENGQVIPGARLDRILIPDPPKAYNERLRAESLGYGEYPMPYPRQLQQPPAPPPPQKSAGEQRLDQLKDSLFEKLLIRALDPPVAPAPDPLSALSPDDRLALGLLQRGDILESAVTRIANLAQAPDRIESSTWKDKLADAGLQLVTHNPDVVKTATDIISRMVMAIATTFAPRSQAAQVINEPIPIRYPPAQQVPTVHATPPPQIITGLPETPQQDETDEDIEIDMMEDVTKLLLSDRPLRLDDPVILELREDYPAIFDAALLGIATTPSTTIIQYLCSRSKFCADMFQSSVTGPHLRDRLDEFKQLLTQDAVSADTNTTEENPTSLPAV